MIVPYIYKKTNSGRHKWRHNHIIRASNESLMPIHLMCHNRRSDSTCNHKIRQAQRRAAAETAAFIRVVRYNDESSFNLDNDFDMNPVSPKTYPHMGPIYMSNPYGAHNVFVHLFHWIPCWFPNIVQISAQLVQKGPACCPVGVPDLSYKQQCTKSRVMNCSVATICN